MRRRHKIKDVRCYNHDGRSGVIVETKAATFTLLAFPAKRPALMLLRIRHFLPHLWDYFKEQPYLDEDDLKDFLIGKYLYGKVTEVERDGMISTVIT
uniref:Uncharacterized protein n=1 Tax=viral metagenome TaxID=1070528 RepID=A0A6M3X6A1_9ZZZZ